MQRDYTESMRPACNNVGKRSQISVSGNRCQLHLESVNNTTIEIEMRLLYNKTMQKEKNPAAVTLGSLGGKKAAQNNPKSHFQQRAYHMNEVRIQKKIEAELI